MDFTMASCNWPERWPKTKDDDDIHVIDPDGDILLQLNKWSPVESIIPDEDKQSASEDGFEPSESPSGSSIREASPDGYSPTVSATIPAAENLALLDLESVEGSADSKDSIPNVYLRVSSRHLILASKVFRAMLSPNGFQEGEKLRTEGTLVIKLSDDPDALIILMNIIHGAIRKVPRKVELDIMVKLAELIDYFDMHESVEVFSETWISKLKQSSFPKIYDGNVISWLYISWIFRLPDEFTAMSRLLICQCDYKSLAAMNDKIPLPQNICEKIQQQRKNAIESIINVLHSYIDIYITSKVICTHQRKVDCDATILGSLIKNAAILGIWPRPKPPYHDIVFDDLATKILDINFLDSYVVDRNYGYEGHNHSIKTTIYAKVKSLMDKHSGLTLECFLPKDKKSRRTQAGASYDWDVVEDK